MADQQATNVARTMWSVLEPIHALTYFAPETQAGCEAAGFKGFWMSYFACRSAPLGQPSAELVTAVFYNFSPVRVAGALPDAWRLSTPQAALRVRLEAVEAASQRLFAQTPSLLSGIVECADLAEEAAKASPVVGRPMAAANAALPRPTSDFARLWQALTTIRESRGDGHVAALVAADLGPTEALVTLTAAGGPPMESFQRSRGWTGPDLARAQASLRERGYLTPTGTFTTIGRQVRDDVEFATDRAAQAPWRKLGTRKTARLFELTKPMATTIFDKAEITAPNPIGLPDPRGRSIRSGPGPSGTPSQA